MQNYSPDHIKSNAQTYFRTFKEESIPDVKVSADRKSVHEQTKKPVQGKQCRINPMNICNII